MEVLEFIRNVVAARKQTVGRPLEIGTKTMVMDSITEEVLIFNGRLRTKHNQDLLRTRKPYIPHRLLPSLLHLLFCNRYYISFFARPRRIPSHLNHLLLLRRRQEKPP